MKWADLSLRWRLTLWYVGLMAAVLVAFSGAVYVALGKQLREGEDDALQNLALLLDRTITYGDGKLRMKTSDDASKGRERFVRLYSVAGTSMFDNSAAIGQPVVSVDGMSVVTSKHRRFDTIRVGNGAFRVMSAPVSRNNTVVGVLQVAESLEEEQRPLERLLLILLVTIPATLVLASYGGAFLAKRALTPIDSLITTAQQISSLDLSKRLDLPPRNDELGRLAATFDTMLARLERAFHQQRQFTADASHELRTPLTAMRGQIEVALREDRAAEDYRAVLRAVLEQNERMGRLVGNLLMLARADGGLQLRCEPLDLALLLHDVADQLQPLAAAKQITLETSTPPVLPLVADEDRLLQILFNLIDNAIKYTPAGGCVQLACHASAEGTHLTISDTGPGIPADALPRIFDRFYRVDTARRRVSGGTGLGLAIVRALVDAHGGTIAVDSEEGRGTTFTIVLPAPDRPRS